MGKINNHLRIRERPTLIVANVPDKENLVICIFPLLSHDIGLTAMLHIGSRVTKNRF